MDKQLRRILDLIRKTGDRMVVTDTNGEDVYVVMGLEQYESLVDVLPSDDDGGWDEDWWNDDTGLDNPQGTDDVSLRETDVSLRETLGAATAVGGVSAAPADIWEAMRPAGGNGETWDIGKMSDVEKSDLERQFEDYQRQKAEGGNSKLEGGAKEEGEKDERGKKDEDFGEEQFYLEPIE